jgi:hypothetical protein
MSAMPHERDAARDVVHIWHAGRRDHADGSSLQMHTLDPLLNGMVERHGRIAESAIRLPSIIVQDRGKRAGCRASRASGDAQ